MVPSALGTEFGCLFCWMSCDVWQQVLTSKAPKRIVLCPYPALEALRRVDHRDNFFTLKTFANMVRDICLYHIKLPLVSSLRKVECHLSSYLRGRSCV
jgi:hypothetical protein